MEQKHQKCLHQAAVMVKFCTKLLMSILGIKFRISTILRGNSLMGALFFRKDIQHKMGMLTETVLAATILIFFTSNWGLHYVFFTSFGLALAPLGLLELYNTIANYINIREKSPSNPTHNFYHSLFGILAAGSATFPIALTIGLQFSKWNPFLFSVATGALALKAIEHVIFESSSQKRSFAALFTKNALLKLLGFITLAFALYNVEPSWLADGWIHPGFVMFFFSGVCYSLDTVYKLLTEKSPVIESDALTQAD